ncbi:MAG: hypothetical protein QXS98_05265 [Candidatus Nitrosocaldus sp.]
MIDTLLTYISPIIGGVVGIYSYYTFKRRLHTVRQFIDTLDDALYDDRISEEEFRSLWSRFKAMFSGNST